MKSLFILTIIIEVICGVALLFVLGKKDKKSKIIQTVLISIGSICLAYQMLA